MCLSIEDWGIFKKYTNFTIEIKRISWLVSVAILLRLVSESESWVKQTEEKMGGKIFFFLVASALIAYYIYRPLPENVEEPWKLMLLDASFRSLKHVVSWDIYFLCLCLRKLEGESCARENNNQVWRTCICKMKTHHTEADTECCWGREGKRDMAFIYFSTPFLDIIISYIKRCIINTGATSFLCFRNLSFYKTFSSRTAQSHLPFWRWI